MERRWLQFGSAREVAKLVMSATFVAIGTLQNEGAGQKMAAGVVAAQLADIVLSLVSGPVFIAAGDCGGVSTAVSAAFPYGAPYDCLRPEALIPTVNILTSGKSPTATTLPLGDPTARVPGRAARYALVGLGIAVLSTSKGLMTDREARRNRMGGEILCYVW